MEGDAQVTRLPFVFVLGYWLHQVRGCRFYGGGRFSKWLCVAYDIHTGRSDDPNPPSCTSCGRPLTSGHALWCKGYA